MAKPTCTKSERAIKTTLRGLRKIVETSKDEIEIRIAYAVEQALRWSTEETVGWKTPDQDVIREAEILRKRLGASR